MKLFNFLICMGLLMCGITLFHLDCKIAGVIIIFIALYAGFVHNSIKKIPNTVDKEDNGDYIW